jgi:hypothetical protein
MYYVWINKSSDFKFLIFSNQRSLKNHKKRALNLSTAIQNSFIFNEYLNPKEFFIYVINLRGKSHHQLFKNEKHRRRTHYFTTKSGKI